jgi:transposase
MSLSPQSLPSVPAATVRVAQAVFPKGNRYMTMRDKLGVFYAVKILPRSIQHKGNPPKRHGA